MAKSITSCDNAFVTNIGAAAASLSRKKHRCCCRFAFAQKTSVLLPLRFRAKNIGAAAASLLRKKHLLAREPAAKRMFSVRKRSYSNNNNKSGSSDAPRKAPQPERKSTPRYGDELIISKGILLFSKIQCLANLSIQKLHLELLAYVQQFEVQYDNYC
ncbi:hypothetical protein LSPCS325_41060 [Lysinibacillus sp. CTST325]